MVAAPPKAMAIGTWKDDQYARAFMETGFKSLMGRLQPMTSGRPQQTIWELKYFASKWQCGRAREGVKEPAVSSGLGLRNQSAVYLIPTVAVIDQKVSE
jgi:hypothetical protein